MQKSLEDLIQEAGGPENLLRAPKFDRTDLPPEYTTPAIIPEVPYQFSSWERESRAWHKSVALFDLTHHMVGCTITGPDAHKLLSRLSCNSLFKSKPVSASQIICVNEDGYMIGDGIVTHLGENHFTIYGAPMVPVWAEYNAQVSGMDVTVEHDQRSPTYANGHEIRRPRFCYQIQGPLAGDLITKLNGAPIDDVRFFGTTEVTIAGHKLPALRHGMAGAVGLEVTGPWELRDAVRDAIMEAGEEFGLSLVGGMAYLVPAIESGWFQAVLPGVYDGAAMKGFREWVKGDDHFALMRLQGSKTYDAITGYYRTPFDLGYGRFLNLDHECIGRDALAAMDAEAATKKVTLAWNAADATALFGEMLNPEGRNVRFPHLPASCDAVGTHYDTLTINGRDAGISAYTAFSTNERTMLSMALVNPGVEIGDEVVIGWGEAGGGYGKFQMPATETYEIRARVSPAPYTKVAREQYRSVRMAS